jgi:MoxR-like ATPase
LPEAQLDRFMFHVQVDYPTEDEELEIVQRTTADQRTRCISATLNAEQIIQLTKIVRKIPVADHVARYALRLARRTRHNQPDAADFVKQYVMWGAGPRASQYLVLGAKARAALAGRLYAGVEDVQAIAAPVLAAPDQDHFLGGCGGHHAG